MRMYHCNPARPDLARAARLFAAAAIAALTVALALPATADAARVSGTLMGYDSSAPLASRDLHFEDSVTLDVYLAPTHSDGSFAVELPPGLYNLRAERGVILARAVAVGNINVMLGNVSERAPYTPARLFELQRVAYSILTSPAPSTAYIMTADTAVVPASAESVPKPQVDWNKLPPGSEATGPTGMDLPPPAETPSPGVP